MGFRHYELYIQEYADAHNGSIDGALTQEAWLESLKGTDGQDGQHGSNGTNGLSAYEIYLQEYAEAHNGSTDGALTQEAWIESLKGENGTDFWELNPQGLAFYPKDDGTFAVGVGYAKLLTEITVPAEYQGRAVTSVIEDGFYDCDEIETVILPNTITSIDSKAFADCDALLSVTVGDIVYSSDSVISFNEYTAFIGNDVQGNIALGEDVFQNTFMSVVIEDSSDNDTTVSISITNIRGGVTSLYIKAALNSSTDIGKAEFTIPLSNKPNYTGELDLGTYGLFKDVELIFYAGDAVYAEIDNAVEIGVSADEYNIAHLNATYPVLVFSLMLDEITQGGTLPTFVALERTAQYNWEELPYNMQMMPFATIYDASQTTAFHHLRAGIADYILELYTLNPNSKFNLYIVDNYLELILQYFVANKIPESSYSVIMLSDGSGTAGILSSTFASENTAEGYQSVTDKYSNMAANWADIKNYFWEAGEYSNTALAEHVEYVNTSNSSEYSLLNRYAYILAKEEENVSWWVNRLRTAENLSAINTTFAEEIRACTTEYYTNNLLAALTEDEKTAFLTLYQFNDEMFSIAEQEGKEAIVILGTSWSGENGNLYEYIRMTIELYGTDNYVYYYKGHPGYPTAQYTERQDYFNRLAEEGFIIYELDNAIAAEIILFFNPEVYVAGYSTSTFDSLDESSEEKALAIFGARVGTFNQTYKDLFDIYVSSVSESVQQELIAEGVSFIEGHSYFLMEYNNSEGSPTQVENYRKHEIAIYDSTENAFTYYKMNTNTDVYEIVDADGQALVEEGIDAN